MASKPRQCVEANTLILLRNTAVGLTDLLDDRRIRRRCFCTITLLRRRLRINKPRNFRSRGQKPKRKNEMTDRLRHKRAKRPASSHRLGKTHADVQAGKKIASRR